MCPACRYRVGVVRNGVCSVARLVKGEWMKACPRAVSLVYLVDCPDLQRAFEAGSDRARHTPGG